MGMRRCQFEEFTQFRELLYQLRHDPNEDSLFFELPSSCMDMEAVGKVTFVLSRRSKKEKVVKSLFSRTLFTKVFIRDLLTTQLRFQNSEVTQ